jgi:hypothetical protein
VACPVIATIDQGIRVVPWRWEIYCAGKPAPVERSPVFFESMAEAIKEGKEALAHLLAKAKHAA